MTHKKCFMFSRFLSSSLGETACHENAPKQRELMRGETSVCHPDLIENASERSAPYSRLLQNQAVPAREKRTGGEPDRRARDHGLIFTREMRKRYRHLYAVFRRPGLMVDEYRRIQRQPKNTVLLGNVHCTGEGIGCNRACFLILVGGQATAC